MGRSNQVNVCFEMGWSLGGTNQANVCFEMGWSLGGTNQANVCFEMSWSLGGTNQANVCFEMGRPLGGASLALVPWRHAIVNPRAQARDAPQDCKPSTLNFHILPLVWLFPLTNSNMGAAWH